MSTSIALVTCAEVSRERRMCSAMPLRIADIGSKLSPGCAAEGAGASAGLGGAGAAASGAGAGSGSAGAAGWAGAAGAACPPDSMKLRMSFLVTRPPRPVPRTWLGSTPCSEAIFATTGETNVLPFVDGASACAGSDGAVGAGDSPLDAASVSAAAPAVAADHGELRPDVDRRALLHEDLRQDAAAGARNLGVDLVRRDLEQRLVGLDLLALLLEPLGDRALGDGHAHLRHDDVDWLGRGHLVLRQLSQPRGDVVDLRDERLLERRRERNRRVRRRDPLHRSVELLECLL